MARIEKTVFISYRRTDVYTALAVYENLKNQGYDVFFDYRSISSGDFEQIITSNIRARAHFILILTPTALDRCNAPDDWLRREIEVAIDEKRNIIPLFFRGFQFGDPSIKGKLTGKLRNLSRYNGLNVHEDYFDEAMHRLLTQYLNIPLDTVLHPVSTDVQKVVREEQVAADQALEQIENVKELSKKTDEKLSQPQAKLIPSFNSRLIANIGGRILLLALVIWGAVKLFQNQSVFNPNPTSTSQQFATGTSSPAETSIPPRPTVGIGSTRISDKDGMTILYVPAGEFRMGSNIGLTTERPIHTVYLDAFWIDQTEVTNAMYSNCVNDGECREPSNTIYYDDSNYASYPVVYVAWDDAINYCSWADRRLPTEAEWEKAASWNDSTKENYIWPWGNDFSCTKGNFDDETQDDIQVNPGGENCDGFRKISPVGSFSTGASPYGALDMAGSVHEWVNDWFDVYPGGDPSTSDKFGKNIGCCAVAHFMTPLTRSALPTALGMTP